MAPGGSAGGDRGGAWKAWLTPRRGRRGGERVEGLGLQRIGDRGLETLEAFGFGLLGGVGEGAGSGQRVGLEGAGAGRA